MFSLAKAIIIKIVTNIQQTSTGPTGRPVQPLSSRRIGNANFLSNNLRTETGIVASSSWSKKWESKSIREFVGIKEDLIISTRTVYSDHDRDVFKENSLTTRELVEASYLTQTKYLMSASSLEKMEIFLMGYEMEKSLKRLRIEESDLIEGSLNHYYHILELESIYLTMMRNCLVSPAIVRRMQPEPPVQTSLEAKVYMKLVDDLPYLSKQEKELFLELCFGDTHKTFENRIPELMGRGYLGSGSISNHTEAFTVSCLAYEVKQANDQLNLDLDCTFQRTNRLCFPKYGELPRESILNCTKDQSYPDLQVDIQDRSNVENKGINFKVDIFNQFSSDPTKTLRKSFRKGLNELCESDEKSYEIYMRENHPTRAILGSLSRADNITYDEAVIRYSALKNDLDKLSEGLESYRFRGVLQLRIRANWHRLVEKYPFLTRIKRLPPITVKTSDSDSPLCKSVKTAYNLSLRAKIWKSEAKSRVGIVYSKIASGDLEKAQMTDIILGISSRNPSSIAKDKAYATLNDIAANG